MRKNNKNKVDRLFVFVIMVWIITAIFLIVTGYYLYNGQIDEIELMIPFDSMILVLSVAVTTFYCMSDSTIKTINEVGKINKRVESIVNEILEEKERRPKFVIFFHVNKTEITMPRTRDAGIMFDIINTGGTLATNINGMIFFPNSIKIQILPENGHLSSQPAGRFQNFVGLGFFQESLPCKQAFPMPVVIDTTNCDSGKIEIFYEIICNESSTYRGRLIINIEK